MTFLPVPGTDVSFCEHETTVQNYAAYAAALGNSSDRGESRVNMEWKDVEYSGHKQTLDHPVVNVNWEDARAFCQWLSQKDGRTYRLPTDHEWSVAVGIGNLEDPKLSPAEKDMKLADVFPWGSTWPPPAGSGNFSGSESAWSSKIGGYTDTFPFTAPVDSFTLNHYGIKDLSGNVWEWCEDKNDQSSSAFVLRGGSWPDYDREYALSSYRNDIEPTRRSISIGFRCVLVSEGVS